jgi:tryptophan 2,3-dioxygenase
MSDKDQKYSAIHYQSYLQLDKILDAQQPRSSQFGEEAHEETLFIIIHQVYELWFKQMLHEIKSIVQLYEKERIEESHIALGVSRMNRVIEIQKLIIEQIRVMETMTPLDFLDFRNYLFPASGFQSLQFRELEILLGLDPEQRITYNNSHYAKVFDKNQKQHLGDLQSGSNLFTLIESWLERTPFLNTQHFSFIESYKEAVQRMLDREQNTISNTDILSPQEKEMRLKMLGDTGTYFESIFSEEKHLALQKEGKIRLSYKATLAALLISLYRDEPILHMPFLTLSRLVDMDELMTTWRYRHAQMVLRMLGRKIGTGGSSGHEYLMQTALKHQIFVDLHNISTFLIPRSELPALPLELKRSLGFHFSQLKAQ